MDKTKSKLAAFFDPDDDEPSFPQKPVDDQKLSTYAQGIVRKSKREKEKEAAEAKRKEEEANAAKIYAEFLETFEGEEVGRRKRSNNMFVKAGQEDVYAPAVSSPSSGKGKEVPRGPRMFEDEAMPPSPPAVAPKPKGKRAMDSFLEEIKREQAVRESKFARHARDGRSVTALAAYEGQSGSKDRGDPETTNVFVANLPQHVTEQSLGMFFARCGPVGSVKIMWPRGDASQGVGAEMTASRRARSTGLSGFVSFMRRKDAELALREYDGFEWGGSVLRVGWSKAVPIAAKPAYVTAKTISHSHSRSPRRGSRDRHHSDSRSPSYDRYRNRGYHSSSRRSRSRSRSYSPSPSRSRNHRSSHRYDERDSLSRSPRRYDSRSRSRSRSGGRGRGRDRSRSRSSSRPGYGDSEEDQVTEQFLRTVANEVRGHGKDYEESLKEREKKNPKYAFMHRGHRRNRLYRSLIDQRGDLDPEFEDEGYNSVYSTDSAEESERERSRKNELGRLARRRFEAMLRALSGRRGEIARCMAFSLEHAEAAAEVADIIVASLLVDGTPVPRKVARLHLICDILHNSAAPLPSAWKFRQEFQSRLGIVFDHLSTIYHSFPGRITAETFKKQILSVVDIWEDWIVFPPEFTQELKVRLEGASVKGEEGSEKGSAMREEIEQKKETTPSFTSKFKASSFKPAEEVPPVAAVEDEDGEPMDEGSDVDGVPVDDVDGEPIAEDLDGEPMDDVDGEPIGDVDGEPMKEDDVDGEPMDDDIDGAPVQV
ncbi:hypothetical protein K474DRAFT_1691944 [Panus rudis PR-1116 ss-1]|nr:hypothetical protein K474DRAFT_1691944 [Panus rudis PR-1116 ss-1]